MAKRFSWGTGDGRKLYKGLGVAYRLKIGSFKKSSYGGWQTTKGMRVEGWRLRIELMIVVYVCICKFKKHYNPRNIQEYQILEIYSWC